MGPDLIHPWRPSASCPSVRVEDPPFDPDAEKRERLRSELADLKARVKAEQVKQASAPYPRPDPAAQEREWQPGDKAYVEVEVLRSFNESEATVVLDDVEDREVRIDVSPLRLRPVSGGGEVEAATERVREFLAELDGFYSPDDPIDDVLDYADGGSSSAPLLLSDIRLLVGGLGRSEAETCGLCRNPATGLASINDTRYCHGDDDAAPTCYEVAVMRGTGFPRPGLSIPRDAFSPARVAGTTDTDGSKP